MIEQREKPERFIEDELQLFLRVEFVELYLEDSEFCANLEALESNFEGPLPSNLAAWWFIKREARSWASNVSAFCHRWGLTFEDNSAELAFHFWCAMRREQGESIGTHGLTSGFWAGVNLPDCGDPPVVKIDWDPICESRKSAEDRVLSEVNRVTKERFDIIASAHEYLPKRPQRRPARYTKHLEWLYQRQRHGLSYAAIAKRKPIIHETKAVQQACKRLADEMGLILRPAKRKGPLPSERINQCTRGEEKS